MNPRVIFDKSVFQQIPVTAFVAVDRYFDIIIPPILVREIGGDLARTDGNRREIDAASFVQKLAIRPSASAFVVHPSLLVTNSLLGFPVAMDGRIVAMMDPVPAADGTIGLRVAETLEEEAINRWRQGDFSSIDYLWANRWQRVQKLVRINYYRRTFAKWGVGVDQPRSLQELERRVEDLLRTPALQPALLTMIFSDFSIPLREQTLACKRFQSKRPRQSIEEFAPYAAFCLKANLLLGFGGILLRRRHPHDLRDLEYCYSLPFCEVFASDDNLHKKLVPILKRPNQMFVGLELVEDLRRLGNDWNRLTTPEKIAFVHANRNTPLPNPGSIVRRIWECYRGPNAPDDDPADLEPDNFAKEIMRKQYGSADMLQHLNVERAPFLIQRSQMLRHRAEELYPGHDFDRDQ
jgi:hypothetical protein